MRAPRRRATYQQESIMKHFIRLQKYIADCGLTSRRKAEQWILEGRVELNGQIVTQLGTKLQPTEDVVSVDGKVISDRFRG